MFRIHWKLPVDYVVPPLPAPEPLDTDKYWTLGGFGRCDISQLPDVSSINFVEALEKCKPWERLKLPIDCTMCHDRKQNWPYLFSVHWCYLHCRDCENTFFCEECFVKDEFAQVRSSKHEGHEFVRIQSRPLSAPLFDGSQLEQLEYLQKAETDDEFFTYFPWFFHTFPGMDNFRNHYAKIFMADMDTFENVGSPDWMALRERLRFPTDWFMRCYAQGDWKPLHKELGPTIESHIQTARVSAQLYSLVKLLEKYNQDKTTQYGAGDIITHPAALIYASKLASTLPQDQKDYFLYTVPVQFMGVLNDQIDQEHIKKLYKTTMQDNEHAAIDSASDIRRLWGIFTLLYHELPAFKALKPSTSPGDTMENFQFLKPEWEPFVRKDHLIQRKLKDVCAQEVSGIPSIEALLSDPQVLLSGIISLDLNSALKAPEISTRSLEALLIWTASRSESEGSGVYESLAWCKSQRQIGNYEDAIGVLTKKDLSDPSIILELQRVYMEQGYIEKAMRCLEYFISLDSRGFSRDLDGSGVLINPEDTEVMSHSVGVGSTNDGSVFRDTSPVARQLLTLRSKFLSCKVYGGWDEALDSAKITFETYLKLWRLPTGSAESPILLIYLEIYYQLIILETCRDLGSWCVDRSNGIKRLGTIRQYLMDLKTHPQVVWDVLLAELELKKLTGRAQYWDHEMNFSVHQYNYQQPESFELLRKFSVWTFDINEPSPMLSGNALLLQAELLSSTSTSVSLIQQMTHQAGAFYEQAGSEAGRLDVEFLLLKLQKDPPFISIKSCYDRLRARNDINRLRVVRAYQMSPDIHSSEWLLLTRLSLGKLAKEAGDNVAHHRWNLRRYAADNMIVSSIDSAEKIISSQPDVIIQSNLLTTMASFNLSRAYLTLGNHFEAALNGILHAALTSNQNDSENFQRAILNLLQIFTETVNADKVLGQRVIGELSQLWNGWLHWPVPRRWEHQGPRCDEIDRLIDGACFLPLLAGKLGRETYFNPLKHDSKLEQTLVSHLELAFSLYFSLPPYMLSIVGPKLSLAVGAVAVYIGNKELAIRSYWEGVKCCHSQDLFTMGTLRLEAGRLMTILAELDPEHWVHVVPAGRSLIQGAVELFLKVKILSGSLLKIVEANLWLLRTFVVQARAMKQSFDRTYNEPGGFQDANDLVGRINKVASVLEQANKPVWHHEVVELIITERLRLENPYEATRHMVSLSSSPMLQQTRQLILEVCLIMKQIEDLQGKDPGGSLWYFIQRFKANVLFQQSQFIVNPVDILRHIEEDPEASRLYLREQELLREGPQALGDSRLDQVSLEMDKNPHLKPLKDRRSMRGVNKEDLQPLKHIAHATTSNDVSIITIDWIQYHDIFVVVGYNITSSKIVFLNYTKECKAAQVEKWVNSHLKVSPEKLRSTLRSPTVFNELRPLVAMIADTCNEGDLLVFCPSQLLNAVPLHALPYNQTEDTPIIYYHPIVYAPSNAILKDCVQRALSPRPRVQFHASLFGRYGNSRPAEELAITKTIDEIASLMSSSNASVKTILGKDVTHGAFSSNLTGADILHFQGHVSSPEIKQFLVLEPDEASSSGSFTLQDIFATGLDASLAVLMGCGSGSQIINRGDDAMGLISAFFAAGVTSVIGTLWPLDNADAVNFSRSFYKYILEKKAGQETDLVNLAAAMRAAVLDIRACQRVKCKEKRDLKARLKCHINETNAPYHWAQFSLWGSWVCRGLGVDGSGNLSESWSFSKPADVTTAQPEPEPEPEPAKPKVQSPKAKKGFFDKLRGRWPS